MNEGHSPGAGQPGSPRLPHAVFVSYSNDDKAVADAVCAALEAENIGCWMVPRDVQDDRPHSGQMTQAIREAPILLLILSQAANRSKHVLDEVERATHCRNHLLTFRIESIAPSDDLAYFLGADQRVDGFRPLPPSQHFPTLIQHTRRLLQIASAEAESGGEEEADSAAPETFAHFRILRHADGSLFKLGKGGMGVTYKAIDTVLSRPVALKVISAELVRSPQARHRFLREAQAAALMHHPHVATIYHFGEEADSYFYAMEFVEGEDLERYVERRGPLAPVTALRVVLQVAQALEAAQARQLIHRDIKPGNIMAVGNRAGSLDVKLIDFGLAKGAGAETLDAARITRTQDFVGSPAFASPEQCQTKELDIRSDIYSLGVTLWYLLSGKRPFSGPVGEVMIAQVITPPPFDQLAHLPEPVLELLRRMLAKDPNDRFQTPEELQDAVEEVAERLASDFGLVPERIVAEGVPRKYESADTDALQVDPHAPAEPLQLATLASPIFDGYLGIEVGAVIGSRYRLLEESREGNGGRFFLARDEQAAAGEPSEVGLKLLHPALPADPSLLDLLENEIEVIRRATHPNLVRLFRLERSTPCPFLVREWIHGFLLFDLLRWRRSLNAPELHVLLGPLAPALDFVSNNGLGLVDVSVRKILVVCPKEIAGGDFRDLARGKAQGWNRCTLKLNPLSLAPLLFRSRNGWDRQTVVPTSRVLSMTQAGIGIRGSKAARLYGRLIYELLSGHPLAGHRHETQYTPLPELDEEGNATLRHACLESRGTDGFKNCAEFWEEFQAKIATRTVHQKEVIFPSNTPQGAQRALFDSPSSSPTMRVSRLFGKRHKKTVSAVVTATLLLCLILMTLWWLKRPLATPISASSQNTSKPQPFAQLSTNPAATHQPTTSPPEGEKQSTTLNASVHAPIYLAKAQAEFYNGQFKEAVSDYTRAIEAKPDDPIIYKNRGNAYLHQDEYDDALSDYDRAIRLKPDYAEAHSNRGHVYTNSKQYDKAISEYTEAIRLKPDLTVAYTNRGNLYYELKQYDKAISDYAEAIRLKPDDASVYTNRGNVYYHLKQYDKAVGDYTEAIRLKPDDASAYTNRGNAYDELNQYEKAISDHNEAVRLGPDDAYAYNNRGSAYYHLKQYEKAISDYNEAIRLMPDCENCYHNRALAYEKMGRFQEAKADNAKANELAQTQGSASNATPSWTPDKNLPLLKRFKIED